MGNIKRLIIDLWKLLTWDWPVLLLFEVIYKMVFLTVMSLSENGIDFALSKAGIEYLTNQNLFQVLVNPYSLAALVLSFLMVIYFSFLEITAIILYCHMGMKRGEGQCIRPSDRECQKSRQAVLARESMGSSSFDPGNACHRDQRYVRPHRLFENPWVYSGIHPG